MYRWAGEEKDSHGVYHISRLHSWVRLLRLRIAAGTTKQRREGGEKRCRAQDAERRADRVTEEQVRYTHHTDQTIVCSRLPSRAGSLSPIFEKLVEENRDETNPKPDPKPRPIRANQPLVRT